MAGQGKPQARRQRRRRRTLTGRKEREIRRKSVTKMRSMAQERTDISWPPSHTVKILHCPNQALTIVPEHDHQHSLRNSSATMKSKNNELKIDNFLEVTITVGDTIIMPDHLECSKGQQPVYNEEILLPDAKTSSAAV